MRVVVYEGPHSMRVADQELPTPGDGHVLVEVRSVGICGSDIHGYTGETGRRSAGMIMGHEVAGRVVDSGGLMAISPEQLAAINPLVGCGHCRHCAAGAPNVCQQRRIMGVSADFPGGHAEFIAVPAENVVPMANGTRPEIAALVEPLAVGENAFRQLQLDPDEPLLVIGAGAIGIAAVVAARRAGFETIIVSEPMADRREAATTFGAIAAGPEVLGEVVRDAAGGSVAGVIDAVGTSQTIATSLSLSRPGATVVVVGMNAPDMQLSSFDLVIWERKLLGAFCYTPECFADTAAWVARNEDYLAPLVGACISLDEVPETFSQLAAGTLPGVKAVLVI